MQRARAYYSLTKPGVLFGNVLTTVAGFVFASSYYHSFDIWLGLAVTVGTTLVIASACVLNNVLDQDIDRIMTRTRTRAVAAGEIASGPATLFAAFLGLVSLIILAIWTPLVVVVIGVVGYIVYVWLYGALSKRRSTHGTLVGSISGAMPVMAGYCAVSGQIDLAAALLFFALFFWQFPEFFSIAIYRHKEYKAANIPVVPVVRGTANAVVQIYIYTVLFVLSAVLLTPLGYTGWIYEIVMVAAGGYWIFVAARGFRARNSESWARQNFHISLIMLMLYSAMISIGPLLP